MDLSNIPVTRTKDIRYVLPEIEQDQFNVRTRAALKLIKYALGEPKINQKILDLACGRGELLRLLAEDHYNVIGLDSDPNCVQSSQQYAQCLLGDGLLIDNLFHENEFDLVVCSHFLEHTENPKVVVEKIKYVSNRYIVLLVPNLAQFITLEHKAPRYVTPGHLHGWDPGHFKTFLELHCSLKIIKWESDQVIIPGRPLWRRYKFIHSIIRKLETKILPKVFPYISNSLIVLCEKNSTGTDSNRDI